MPVPGSPGGAPARRLARDRAYDALKDAILTRTILPGERLDDDTLQAWLGMSKTPIRQALHALTVEGFVETVAQSHTRVVEPRLEDAVANLQTIGVVVLGILDFVFEELDENERRELVGDLDVLIDALDREDIEDSIAGSQAYYARLMARCPNRVLVEFSARTLAARAYYVMVAYRALEVKWGEAAAEYRLLRAAIEGGDGQAVADATKLVFRIGSPDTAIPKEAS
ncbi:GntR family transcriptional regulator [Leifsonia shinshuensis]|uniref:GntR family transcriptional regulator n=1 Tax=Leifsonia shinshuensis TaxID=150026 RepID=UPI001F512557|nr:GntR family transcriptional regulator [Leifsonia shinshuensis]MCI0159361.1 GntR family transcriptional regulator [Leifsonia shinshuensis]